MLLIAYIGQLSTTAFWNPLAVSPPHRANSSGWVASLAGALQPLYRMDGPLLRWTDKTCYFIHIQYHQRSIHSHSLPPTRSIKPGGGIIIPPHYLSDRTFLLTRQTSSDPGILAGQGRTHHNIQPQGPISLTQSLNDIVIDQDHGNTLHEFQVHKQRQT